MKGKLKRFAVIADRDNVIQLGKEKYETIKGNWNGHFDNDHPLTVELACGRGEYSVGLASRLPERNYIGVDIKGDRLWKGSTLAIENELKNVAFLRAPILNIESFFSENEVDEIWLTFPDPRPKKRDEKRRLTYPRFLSMYKKILHTDGWFRLKTDNTELFQYTLEVLQQRSDIRELVYTLDLYNSPYQDECFNIKTRYEEMFTEKGEVIKYLKFKFVE